MIGSCATFKYKTGYQKKFFPEQIHKLYIAMPFSEFEKIKNLGSLEIYDGFDFRTEFIEKFKTGDIEEITYYFTRDDNNYLYEFIIKYNADFDLKEFCRRKYGAPNAEDEWRFPVTAKFDLMIWTFNNSLVIVGNLPGTEWEK